MIPCRTIFKKTPALERDSRVAAYTLTDSNSRDNSGLDLEAARPWRAIMQRLNETAGEDDVSHPLCVCIQGRGSNKEAFILAFWQKLVLLITHTQYTRIT